MKRGKKLIILLAVLAVLLAATCAVLKLAPDETDAETEDTGVSVFTMDPNAATELTWTYEGETLTFVKGDGGWAYAGDSTFPLKESYLTSMLTALSDVVAGKTIESPEDLAQYGLEEPACTVTVTTDTTAELLIGDETGIGGERYLSTGDGNVYLVDAAILDNFSYRLLDLVEKETIPSMTDITSFAVTSNTRSFMLSYQENGEEDGYVWFWNGDSELPLDTELAEALIETVTSMSWGACVDYSAADRLSDYGLDMPTVTVTVNYVETTQVETNETDEDGNPVYETRETSASFVLEIGEDADSCYARIAGSDIVYEIDASVADAMLTAAYDDLSPDSARETDQ